MPFRLLGRQQIQNQLLGGMALVVLLASAGFSVALIVSRRAAAIREADAKLLTAAEGQRARLGPDYFNRIRDGTEVTPEQFDRLVAVNDDVCRRLHLQYVWSVMVLDDGRIVFTSATHSDLRDPASPCAKFLEVHNDPDAFSPALRTMQTSFCTFRNQWGEGRMVLVPERDSLGRVHIFGASMQLGEFYEMVGRTVAQAVGMGGLVLALALLIAWRMAQSLSLPIVRLTRSAESMAKGDLDTAMVGCGSPELTVLAHSMDTMRQALRQQLASVHEGREHLAATLRSIGDGVISTDDQGRVVSLNTVAEQLSGWTADEARGRPLAEVFRIVNSRTRQVAEDPVAKVLRDASIVGLANHTALIARDGTERQIADSAAPIRARDGRIAGVVLVFRDVTAEYRLQAALRESEQHLHALFSSMAEGVGLHELVFNEGGQPVNYRLVDVNPQYERILGLRRDQVVGKLATEVYGTAEPPHLKEYAAVAVSGAAAMMETYFAPMDRFFEISIAPWGERGFATIFSDISGRKRYENALIASEHRFRAIFSSAFHHICLLSPEGKVLAANETALRFGGVSEGDVIGRSLWDRRWWLASTVSHEPLRAAVAQAARGQTVRHEARVVGAGGKEAVIDFSLKPIVDANGQVLQLIAEGHDITERKRMEEQRLVIERQMLQTQKLESLGVLAGGIAHDFNNLLTSVLGNVSLALDDEGFSAASRQSLIEIENAARHAADLCRQMLAYSGKGRFVVENLRLTDLVDGVVHLLKTSVSKKVLLNLNLATGMPCMHGDATQIRQIVMNLVINASEAIGERSGVITVSTGAMDCPREYLRETFLDESLPEGLYVWLEVSDTGCGMSAETQHRIFEPFFTTKFTGRGLGLSAVLGIVRGHKGALKVYSELNKGTTFKVLFPAVEDEPADGKANGRTLPGWRGKGTVLLVDDEETIRATGRRVLERLGFSVLTAADGREALQVYRQHAAAITLVLLDLTMPHLDGEEAFRELHRLDPKLCVVMASGYSETDIAARFAGKGLAGFVQKPYDLNSLRQCLRRVLGTADGSAEGGASTSQPTAQS